MGNASNNARTSYCIPTLGETPSLPLTVIFPTQPPKINSSPINVYEAQCTIVEDFTSVDLRGSINKSVINLLSHISKAAHIYKAAPSGSADIPTTSVEGSRVIIVEVPPKNISGLITVEEPKKAIPPPTESVPRVRQTITVANGRDSHPSLFAVDIINQRSDDEFNYGNRFALERQNIAITRHHANESP